MTGWQYDSRNATLFPTRGTRFGVSLTTSVPQSDVEYYVAGLDFSKYMHLVGRWLFRINSNVSYGETYGNSTAIPPYRNRYAGGPGSVRGYRESTLGPKDSNGQPVRRQHADRESARAHRADAREDLGLDARRDLLRLGRRVLDATARASTTSSATLSTTISLMIN